MLILWCVFFKLCLFILLILVFVILMVFEVGFLRLFSRWIKEFLLVLLYFIILKILFFLMESEIFWIVLIFLCFDL